MDQDFLAEAAGPARICTMPALARFLAPFLLCVIAVPALGQGTAAKPAVLATVNGRTVREKDLETLYLINHVPQDDRERVRETLIEQLIDNAVIETFLKQKSVTAPSVDVEAKAAFVIRSIEQQGDKPSEVLAKLGLTEETLRQQLALPIAWTIYTRKALPDAQIRSYFDGHKAELDGTRVRIRQIVRLVPRGADEAKWMETEKFQGDLRQQIAAGKLAFDAAAREHSESPSKEEGGAVGAFGFDGKMPVTVTEAAFRLKPGELSQPIRSPFGVHLLELVERTPGGLSAEDVRPQILDRLSRELWKETVAAERKKARIVRPTK